MCTDGQPLMVMKSHRFLVTICVSCVIGEPMIEIYTPAHTRRNFLKGLAVGAVTLAGSRLFGEEIARFVENGEYADELVRTPSMTEGPFYPDKLPLDMDNDLLLISPKTTPAIGKITHLSGRILDLKGEPIKGATVEIWQVDNNGAYLHSGSDNGGNRDKNFQGYGKFETDSTGAYKFRTIKPVAYPGRTPHIHVKVLKAQRELLCTQLMIKGEPQNDRDGVLSGIRDLKQRAASMTAFEPMKDSRLGELHAKWDIVIGFTPEDDHGH